MWALKSDIWFDSQLHFLTVVANDFSKPNFLVICFVSVYEIDVCVLILNPVILLNFITISIICLYKFLCGFNIIITSVKTSH